MITTEHNLVKHRQRSVAELETHEFPIIAKSGITGAVILFHERNSGTILVRGDNYFYRTKIVGQHIPNGWTAHKFFPYNEDVTLRNTK